MPYHVRWVAGVGVTAMAIIGILWGGIHATSGAEKVAADNIQWSEAVNGVVARVTLSRDQVVNGTPLISTRLWLKNVQDVGNSLPFPWKRVVMTYRVEEAAGKGLQEAGGPVDEVVPIPLDLVLPYKGELSFDVTGHGVGIYGDGLAQIDVGNGKAWVIPRDGKTYYLKGTLEIPRVGTSPSGFGWYGKIEIPAVMIPTDAQAQKGH